MDEVNADSALLNEVHAMGDIRDSSGDSWIPGSSSSFSAIAASWMQLSRTARRGLIGCRTDLYAVMPAWQLLGYHNALAKDLDPDNPKNLSRVVTL